MSHDVTHNGEDYAYVDQTKETPKGVTADVHGGDRDVTSAELNPAYYPANAKPEEVHNEAEKAGSEFPTADPHAVATGEDADGEDVDDAVVESLTDGAPTPVPAGTSASAAVTEGGEVKPEGDDEDGDDEDDDEPAGNASREDWVEFARAQGASEDELAAPEDGGLKRDELREKYGS